MKSELTTEDLQQASLKIVHGFIEDGFTPTEAMFVVAMTLASMFKSQGLSMAVALDRYVSVLTEVYEKNNGTQQ